MKVFTLMILTIFLGKGCSQEAKNDMANATIEYVANTRGFYQKITIQNQKVYLNSDRNSTQLGESKAISDDDWKALIDAFETVELENLSTYKDPTQKRFYDGAAIAFMKVNYKDKAYQTTEFDHGFPPTEIADLVRKIVAFGQQE